MDVPYFLDALLFAASHFIFYQHFYQQLFPDDVKSFTFKGPINNRNSMRNDNRFYVRSTQFQFNNFWLIKDSNKSDTCSILKLLKRCSSFVSFTCYRLYFAKHETQKCAGQMDRKVRKKNGSQQPPEIQFQYSQIAFEGRDVGRAVMYRSRRGERKREELAVGRVQCGRGRIVVQ